MKLRIPLVIFFLTLSVFATDSNRCDKSGIPGSEYNFHLSLMGSDEISALQSTRKKKDGNEDDKKTEEKAESDQSRFDSFLKNTPRPEPKVLRGVLECASVVAVSQTNYWSRWINWVEDWQFEFTWKDQKRRFFSSEGLRFDSNSYFTNWGHGIAGAAYYNLYRTNYFSWEKASLFTAFTSLYWELLVEWREVISLNDNIFTIIGGIPLGETWFQTARFLRQHPRGIVRVLGNIMNPVLGFNRWLDRKKHWKDPEVPWHDFQINVGERQSSDVTGEPNHQYFHLGIRGELFFIPDYHKPATFSGFWKDMTSTLISADLSFGSHGVEEYHLLTRAIPWSWVEQDIRKVNGKVKGSSLLLGIASAFEVYQQRTIWEYDQKNPFFIPEDYSNIPLPTEFTDKYASIHIAGPVADWNLFSGDTHVRLTAEASLDFAMTGAFALNRYTRENDLEGTKSTLANYGYYYGFGYSFDAGFTLRHGNLETSLRYHRWKQNSVENLDRFWDEITNDFDIRDSRNQYVVSLGYRFSGSPVMLLFTLEHTTRLGKILDVRVSDSDTRLYALVSYRF